MASLGESPVWGSEIVFLRYELHERPIIIRFFVFRNQKKKMYLFELLLDCFGDRR